ncbi:BA75_03049T0 [Komagataella pastoris]|uniref:BA75_03049T0 n=1 Tax=Komagataella pastoris TaxID=4922 RepID=A0A1B2JAA3_PICPA|nr:BA75_03049T0 [Komagataella pastoris]
MNSNLTQLLQQLNSSLHLTSQQLKSIEIQELAFLKHLPDSVSQSSYFIPVNIFVFVLLTLGLTYVFIYRKVSPDNDKAIKFEWATPDEAKPHWKGKRLYPTGVRASEDPSMIQCYCPATGQFLGKFKAFTPEDIDIAIKESQVAQKEWKKTTFSERKKVLRTLNEYIANNQEGIARVACRDSGKTMIDASMGEILVTLEKLNWILKNGEKALRVSSRPGPANILMQYKKAEVRYEPLGVVGALVSWNYPFHNLMGPLLASIFTGNAIVIKCSENVYWSSQWFIGLAKMALKVCGHDENLVQLVCTWPEDADYFTSHESLSHLTFIGSKPVAHKVLEAASKSLTPVVVELGGKDSIIVCDDVKDVGAISSIILRGTFQSAGQNCIGIERVIAMPKVYDQLVQILSQRVQELRLGSDIDQLEDIDMGAIITDARFDAMEKLVEDAVSKGARLLSGGKRYLHPNYPQGHYFQPTLLVDVTSNMDIAQNEVFGPILTMMKVDDVEEAIRVTNGTPYGLGSSIFSRSFKTADYIANNIESGNVAINDFATFYVCQLPFGGVKKSGYGKFGGEEGLQGLCVAKSVCYDRFSFINTQIPKPLDYPIANEKKAWKFVTALNKCGYHNSKWEKVKSLFQLARNAN